MSASIKPANRNGVLTPTLEGFFERVAQGKYNEVFKPLDKKEIADNKVALQNPEKYVTDFHNRAKKFRQELEKQPGAKKMLKKLGQPTLN